MVLFSQRDDTDWWHWGSQNIFNMMNTSHENKHSIEKNVHAET